MKRTALIFGLIFAGLSLVGCDDNNPVSNPVPAAPQGVYSVTADRAVEVVWNGVYARDLAVYIVYRSYQANTGYVEIGRVSALANPNLDLISYSYIDRNLTNGVTYYYAVSAVDNSGQESSLSAETVVDTPRPEESVVLYSRFTDPTLAGFDLSATGSRIIWNSAAADVYVDDASGVYYLNVADTLTDIQDVGYTATFDEIGYAPVNGWSRLGYVELIVGHTYIIWTNDSHYAKMRVVAINSLVGRVSFDWAYQTDTNNPELAPALPSGDKPSHGPEYLRKSTSRVAEIM